MNIPAAELQDVALLESLGELPEQKAAQEKSLTKELATPSNHHSPGTTSSLEEKALTLLGSGVPAENVASALGVVPSRISQLLSTKLFADKVAELRYESLQSHNKRDGRYDSVEDLLLDKLEAAVPLMFKPVTIMTAIKTINGAKRRGQAAPDQIVNTKNVVNIILPKATASKFTINIDNQVIKAGEQELHTMPSGNLLKQVEDAEQARIEAPENQTQELSAGETYVQEEESKA